MYFVTKYCGDNTTVAPFENKNEAIRYFNLNVDGHILDVLPSYDRIEISDSSGLILFDYEV